ncbi:hypothetical protein GCM10010924_43800 [Rhizobium wenxiniae]|jgi:hypothetical protein|uniref:Uncharacterized protein n=1 Tax=Rhizobium wenxiniae TaxID=1737357 RepID=A0A7W9YAI1_9HYPH|nr:hypothetical protein [Rhizobium wenxiniae]MBB6165046.1 hypothetical protein [Rhizobium wenxiniae]GGG10123.1 hypothetical protein GCM10010924_43800 [Rhizobium wenxiniae]
MPKEAAVISLKESLSSHNIELFKFGTPLLSIAERLGPPKRWITNAFDQPVPLYWLYPGGLELSFEPEPPYVLTAYKLSPVGAHKGRTTNFSYYVRMRNDFPMLETSVSGFLRSGLWDLERVKVGICAEPNYPVLDICIGCLRIPFLMSSENEEALEDQISDCGNDLKRRIALLDPACDFFGAYFSLEDVEAERFPRDGWTTISGEEYLRQLDLA